MKLIDAVRIVRAPLAADAPVINIFLACGFSPLLMKTLLAAEMHVLYPGRRIAVETGTYGDMAGSLERLRSSKPAAGFIVLEWTDLDTRLGYRQLGGWCPADLPDIEQEAAARAEQIGALVASLHAVPLLVAVLPTLPLPPVSYTGSRQSLAFELRLRELVYRLGARLSLLPNVVLVSPQYLDRESPASSRYDMQSDFASGFPYSVAHASVLAEALAVAGRTPSPKKGLITDLDDTLWAGILGEAGVNGISWDLDHHSQIHGVYQQLLNALAAAGVLIGAASKNEPAIVDAALERADLIVKKALVFPVEAGWGRKSEAVARILKTWNIGGDDVVFVDDNPMELAEVASVFPGTECLLFTPGDADASYRLLWKLRDLFGKPRVQAEDAVRLASIRGRVEFASEMAGSSNGTDFLAGAEALLTLSSDKNPPDPRALELVNKTNQFNLNGVRYSEAEWADRLGSPEAFLLLVNYSDRFGPLGKISVLTGRRQGAIVWIDAWVLSCRAFSRMIEHRCLRELFERFDLEAIQFSFQPTGRNQYLQRFFTELVGAPPGGPFSITRTWFHSTCPELYHRVEHVSAPAALP